MSRETEELVKAISEGNEAEAKDCLKKVLRQKVKDKVKQSVD